MGVKMFYHNLLWILLFFTLFGCGGGGGGGGGLANSPVSLTVSNPSVISSSALTQGSTYSGSTGNYGLATSISLDSYNASGYANVQSFSNSTQLHPTDHLTDTGATTAWSNGWTGYGKNIAILDDFSDIESIYVPITLTRTATQTGYDSVNWPRNAVTVTGTYSVDYHVKFNTTHGDLVSNIAGGDAAASSTATTYNFDASAVTETNCDLNGSVWGATSCIADNYTYYWDG